MIRRFAPLSTDLASAHALILIERAARLEAEAAAAHAQAVNTSTDALIAHLKLEIEKLRRALYDSRSERKARLLEQIELQLEELEAAATEDELAAGEAAARTQGVKSFERKRPSRKPFPEHLPRERVVIPAPTNCPCCGLAKLSKLGEDITERRLLAAIRQASRRLRSSRAGGRSSKPCGRNSPAGPARRLPSRQRRSMSLRAALPGRTCWR